VFACSPYAEVLRRRPRFRRASPLVSVCARIGEIVWNKKSNIFFCPQAFWQAQFLCYTHPPESWKSSLPQYQSEAYPSTPKGDSRPSEPGKGCSANSRISIPHVSARRKAPPRSLLIYTPLQIPLSPPRWKNLTFTMQTHGQRASCGSVFLFHARGPSLVWLDATDSFRRIPTLSSPIGPHASNGSSRTRPAIVPQPSTLLVTLAGSRFNRRSPHSLSPSPTHTSWQAAPFNSPAAPPAVVPCKKDRA
jgi:hypothetical protein